MDLISILPEKEKLKSLLKDHVHVAEWWGGLGDVINHIHWLSCYKDLENLNEGKKALLVISCHNPHAVELVKWHPNLDKMTILNVGFIPSIKNQDWRVEKGLSKDCCVHRSMERGSLTFYPSKEDMEVISSLPDIGNMMVLSPTAGTPERNIPAGIVSSIERDTVDAGFVPVLIGKAYKHHSVSKGINSTVEVRPSHPKTVNLFGKLSVPGTAELLKRVAGSVCTHSSMALLSWHLNKKTFLVYNEAVKKVYVPLGPGGYLFGLPRPGNDGLEFSEYSSERYKKFLEGIRSAESK